MCSGASFEHFTLWVELFLNTWQCSVESHNYFTEKNLTGESPGPRIVWWCRKHAENPPSIFQHGDQLKELIKLGFHWGFYFKKGAILLFELTWILWSLNLFKKFVSITLFPLLTVYNQMWKKGFLLFIFFSIHNAELIWINLIALWFSDKRENYTALWVWAAGFSPYSTYMYIYCCKHNCIYCYLHNHNWYIFSIPKLFTCNFYVL